jgi:MFS family permease
MMNLDSTRRGVVAAVGDRVFYGWAMLAVAGLGMFASGPGQSHNFSVFVAPVSRDLGISSATIASAYGLATLVAALCLPAVGRLVDRFGPRRVSLIVVLGLGLACAFFGAAANYLWLVVGFGLLRFLGQGALMLNCANLVAQWFDRKRGFALGLMALGFAASMAVHPPLGEFLIAEFGWRRAWVALGLITWALMLPPLLLLVVDRPEQLGLRPDGDADRAGDEANAARAAAGLSLAEALRTAAFYILSAGFFAISMMVTALHFYQVTLLESQGVAREIAAFAFPVSAVVMVVMMPVVGRLFDRFKTRFVFAAALVAMAAALVAISLAADPVTTAIYAVLFGLTNAFSLTMYGYLWPRYFGRRHLGSVQGTGQMLTIIGASLGPLPVGLAFDLVGDATDVVRTLALLPLVCAVLALFLRTPPGVPVTERLE